MHPGSQQAPRKHFFRNLHSSICRWVSCQMIKYYAVYYKTLVCVFVSKAPYFVRSCRCKQATLQKPDASSNCWPSVEGAPTRTSLADRARGSSSRGRPPKQSGEVKISRTWKAAFPCSQKSPVVATQYSSKHHC